VEHDIYSVEQLRDIHREKIAVDILDLCRPRDRGDVGVFLGCVVVGRHAVDADDLPT
jgi:DNA-directed RNA polymerase subunit F